MFNNGEITVTTSERFPHDLLVNDYHDIFDRPFAPDTVLPMWSWVELEVDPADAGAGTWKAGGTASVAGTPGFLMDNVDTTGATMPCSTPVVTRGPICGDLVPNLPDTFRVGGVPAGTLMYGITVGLVTLEWSPKLGGNTGAEIGAGGFANLAP